MTIYPDFMEITREDRILFEAAFAGNPPVISEFTFTNLYAWRQAYKLEACLLDDLIILRSESEDKMRFFEPIGKADKRQIIEKILRDYKGIFIRLPEETKSLFAGDAFFSIEPDMDNADYLYKVGDLMQLRGRKYDGKRNLIRKFQSDYSYEYLKLDSTNMQEILNFEETWCVIKDCDNIDGLNNERAAIREMIANFTEFNLSAAAIKIQGNISAMVFAQKLNPSTLVMHVLKADPNISGLYQVMLWEFLSKEAGAFTYVNLEQDLGQNGLRKSKLSYHPVQLVKKYTLRPVDQSL